MDEWYSHWTTVSSYTASASLELLRPTFCVLQCCRSVIPTHHKNSRLCVPVCVCVCVRAYPLVTTDYPRTVYLEGGHLIDVLRVPPFNLTAIRRVVDDPLPPHDNLFALARVCVSVRARVRVCVRVCVCACV